MPLQQITCSQLLRTLFLSLHSFRRVPRLFSIICGLLCKTPGYGVPQTFPPSGPAVSGGPLVLLVFFCRSFIFIHLQIPPRRASICNVLCFHALTKSPFPQLLCIHIYTKRPGVTPPITFHRRSRSRFSEIFCRSDEDRHPDRAQRRGTFFHTSFLVYAQRSRGHSHFPQPVLFVLASKGDLLNVSE